MPQSWVNVRGNQAKATGGSKAPSPRMVREDLPCRPQSSPEWRKKLSESRKGLKPTPKQLTALEAGRLAEVWRIP